MKKNDYDFVMEELAEKNYKVTNGCALVTGMECPRKDNLLKDMIGFSSRIKHATVLISVDEYYSFELLEKTHHGDFDLKNVNIIEIKSSMFPFSIASDIKFSELPTILGELLTSCSNFTPEEKAIIQDTIDRYCCSNYERLKKKEITDINIFDELLKLFENEGNKSLITSVLKSLSKSCYQNKPLNENIFESKKLTVLNINSRKIRCAKMIVDMLLAMLIHLKPKFPNVTLDVYVVDIDNQNFSPSGPIRTIISQSKYLNIYFTGFSQNYYSPGTLIGDAFEEFEEKYFFLPTPESRKAVFDKLQSEYEFSNEEMMLDYFYLWIPFEYQREESRPAFNNYGPAGYYMSDLN